MGVVHNLLEVKNILPRHLQVPRIRKAVREEKKSGRDEGDSRNTEKRDSAVEITEEVEVMNKNGDTLCAGMSISRIVMSRTICWIILSLYLCICIRSDHDFVNTENIPGVVFS